MSTFVARTVAGLMLRRPWPILAAVCLCLASTAAAQSALTGIVHDPSGQLAVGATITVFDLPSQMPHPPTKTSAIGYYEIELPPGDYRIQAELDKLTFSGTARVLANEKTAFDIDLHFYFDQEHVTVPADTLVSSTTMTSQAALGGAFSREALDALPQTNGRTLQSYLSLVPGVVYTDSVGTLAQFTAVGQRRFSNRMTVDGVSADLAIDTRNLGISEAGSGSLPAVSTLGGTQTIVPLDAIEEIQVKTTNASSQDARTPGAQTIVVTRAGTDRFSGEAFTDWRPESLGAVDWFANSLSNPSTSSIGNNTLKGPANSLTGGVSAGGPIVPRRVFYFAALERQRVERPVRATFQVPSLASRDLASDTLRPLLEAFPEPNGPEASDGLARFSGDFPAVSTLSAFSLRVDADLSANQRWFWRVNVGDSNGDWLDPTLVPSTSFDYLEGTQTRTVTAGFTSVLARMTNDLRLNASVNRGSLVAGPSSRVTSGSIPLDLLLPANSPPQDALLSILVPRFQGSLVSGRSPANSQRQLHLADTLSFSQRRHEWRFGLDGRWLVAGSDPAPDLYGFRFNDVNDLLQGRVRALTVQEASPVRVLFTNVSAFAEDTFRAGNHFSLHYGLRYSVAPAPSSRTGTEPLLLEVSALPEPKVLPAGTPLWRTSWGNLAPQVAATYQFGTGTGHETVIRAGWALAFDDLASSGATAFGRGYPYLTTRVLTSPSLPVPDSVWSTEPAELFAPNDRNAYYAFPREYRSPKTYSWQFGIDQAIGSFQRLGVAYAGAAGRDLSYLYAYPAQPPGRLWSVTAFSNDGRSDYEALLAEYSWRLSHGFQAQVSYTWSHAIDLDSGEMVSANAPPALSSPLSNRASADFDRRHVLQAVASYQLPTLANRRRLRALSSDWQVNAVIAARSGAPVNVTANRDIGFGGFLEARPDVVPGVSSWISDPLSPGGNRINPAAFSIPSDLRQGTLGRNALQASPLYQVDLGLSRIVRLGERVVARVRIDAFNVFNIPNFGPPTAELLSLPTVFGRPTASYASALGTGTLTRGGLVPIQQLGGPRSLQIGVRLSF